MVYQKSNENSSKVSLPVCKQCGETGHTKWKCRLTPRKPLVARKPMNKVGNVQKRTNTAVAKWKATQKPNHQGYWTCYMCKRQVDYLMAEHVKSKVHRPDLRTDPNNLKPTCASCNEAKGSKSN